MNAAILGHTGSALEGVVFRFDGRIIRHRGIYLDREAAGRLAAVFDADGNDYARECARQLREAISEHDKYWNEERAA